MTIDKDKLRSLAEAAQRGDDPDPYGVAFQFELAANPATILALLGEIERLEESDQEATSLCDLLAGLLRGVALEVKGPEAPLRRHGFHDLPLCVKTLVQERDQLKAENAQLKNQEIELRSGIDQAKADGAEAWGLAQGRADDIDRLKAENEALAHLLKRFVDGEHDDAEDQNERHHYHGEAQALLARMSGEFQEYSLVPYEALWKQRTELVELRRDAERLDWIDDNLPCDIEDGGLRHAIDAAMAKEKVHV